MSWNKTCSDDYDDDDVDDDDNDESARLTMAPLPRAPLASLLPTPPPRIVALHPSARASRRACVLAWWKNSMIFRDALIIFQCFLCFWRRNMVVNRSFAHVLFKSLFETLFWDGGKVIKHHKIWKVRKHRGVRSGRTRKLKAPKQATTIKHKTDQT